MKSSSKFTVQARLRSFTHAIRGLKFLLKSQHNARLHAIAAAGVWLAGIGCRLSAFDWCIIVLAIMAVWITEALNTALEVLTDLASPEIHPLAGKAKDVAAGAVLIAATGSVIIAALIFIPRIRDLVERP